MKKPSLKFRSAGAGLVCTLALLTAAPTTWAGNATRDEAVALVKKVIADIKIAGVEKTYAAIIGKDARYVDRDLYVNVYGLDGKCLAHGQNPKQVGKDLLDLTDVDGRYFVKDRIAMVRAKPGGDWQEYKFTNPLTKKIEPKLMYCEKLAETAVCAGVYK
jgi:signal transduction histidine kinase